MFTIRIKRNGDKSTIFRQELTHLTSQATNVWRGEGQDGEHLISEVLRCISLSGLVTWDLV